MNAACLHAKFQEPNGSSEVAPRYGVTVRVAERLLVNVLLGEYKIYKKGEWTTRQLPALEEAAPPAESGTQEVDELRIRYGDKSKDELVEILVAQGSAPASKKSRRAAKRPSGDAEGNAKRQRQNLEEVSTSAGASSPTSSTSGAGESALIISMPGPELADLMLSKDGKILDNRKWSLAAKYLPCWLYPLVGAKEKKKNWDWRHADWVTQGTDELQDKVNAVIAKESVAEWYGHVPGRLWVTHQRKPEECNGNYWALGPNCFVVEKFQRFASPVPMKKRGGARPSYEATSEELEMLRAQLPETPPIYHDLSVLDAPGEVVPLKADDRVRILGGACLGAMGVVQKVGAAGGCKVDGRWYSRPGLKVHSSGKPIF